MGWVLVAAALAACHEPPRLERVRAVAVVDASQLDFGPVPVGEWRQATVHVLNVGAVPFQTTDALQLDGNPSFVVQFATGRLDPRAAGVVVVQFHPLQEGALQDRLQVHTDADEGATGNVRLAGVGTPAPIQVFPSLVDFQTLEIDSDRSLPILVVNPIDLPLSVSLAGTQAGQFDADAATVPPLSTRSVTLKYSPHDTGASRARVEVRACASCSAAPVPLLGNAVASAFAFSPAPVPFDSVAVHESSRSRTLATNITWRPVDFSQAATSDASFEVVNAPAARTVQPNQTLSFQLQFNARTTGPAVGALTLSYVSNANRSAQVTLDARGGRPESALTPVLMDFGDLPVGGKLAKTARVSNAGTGGVLHFQGLTATGAVAQFDVSDPQRGRTAYPWSAGSAWPRLSAPALPIATGTDGLDVQVYFQPTAPGPFTVTLAFQTDDPFNPSRQLVATGTAHASGPCTFKLTPAGVLEFGDVPAGWGAVQGFRVENVGTRECAVKDIHLSQDAGGVFFMPGGPLVGGVLEPTDAFAAQIAFKSQAAGHYTGELDLTVNDPSQPVARLPIEAWSLPSCLTAAPNYLDFGAVRLDCATSPRSTYVANQCPSPISVSGVTIGPGTSNEFSITSSPTVPLTVAPGSGFEVQVDYARSVLGQNFSPLFIQAAGEAHPFLVPLLGETNHDGFETEDFVQGSANQLDVLFVVSNTTTMGAYQDRLAQALPGWLTRAAQGGIDLHAAVTTTGLVPKSPQCSGGANGGEAGRLYPVNGSQARYVTATGAAALTSNARPGTCHDLDQGLETMRAALSSPLVDHADDPVTALPNDGNLGFVRTPARMAVVFVADDDDHSGFDPTSYVQFLQALKGPGMAQRTSAWGIIPVDPGCLTAEPPGPRFSSVAQATGGTSLSVCSQDYGPLLQQISAFGTGLQRTFHLKATPTNPGGLVLAVDGQPWTGWSYDAAANAIVFSAGNVPQPGQDIQVRYEAACN